MKQIKTSRLKKNAWDAFSRFIRTRDCLETTKTVTHGMCYTCKKVTEFKNLQAGHLFPGRHNKFLFDEQQVRAQCKYCNLILKGNAAVFAYELEDELGPEIVRAMQESNKEIVQYKRNDYIELEAYFDRKTKELLI